MQVLWIFNHPAPYKIDFFNELGKLCDLTVVFERAREGDRNPSFYSEKCQNYKEMLLQSLKLGEHNNLTFKVRNVVKKTKADIIVMNGYSTFSEMLGIHYLHRTHKPYIFAINGGIPKPSESPLKRKLKTSLISHASFYLAPDDKSASYLLYYGATKDKIGLYPYSTVYQNEIMDSPLSEEEKVKKRIKNGLPKDNVFVSVGQFIKRKNNMALLEAWKQVRKDQTLLLVGGGKEEGKYKKYVMENHLDNVKVIPFKSHKSILELYRLATASIFLTREDIYGHVVNESLSQGCPVIAGKHSNAALHLISNGQNGYLIDSTPQEIARAVQGPFTDEMRRQAIEVASKNSIEMMAKTHYEILERFLTL